MHVHTELKDAFTSELKDGIETITVPIHAVWVHNRLVSAAKKGRAAIARWLSYELHHPVEEHRICGMKHDGRNFIVELKHPGKQFEEFLKSTDNGAIRLTRLNDGTIVLEQADHKTQISPRALKWQQDK